MEIALINQLSIGYFVCLAYRRIVVSVNSNTLSWETSTFMSEILIKFGASRKVMFFKGNVHRMADRIINVNRNNRLFFRWSFRISVQY